MPDSVPRPAHEPPPRKHHGWRGVFGSFYRDDLTKEFSMTRLMLTLTFLLILLTVSTTLHVMLKSAEPLPAGNARAVVLPPKELWLMLGFMFVFLVIGIFGPKWSAAAKTAGSLAIFDTIGKAVSMSPFQIWGGQPRDVLDGTQRSPLDDPSFRAPSAPPAAGTPLDAARP